MVGFGIMDYILFTITLVASAGIGIFFALRGKSKQDSPSDILMGGRDMPIIPTALSLATSLLSGVTLLAVPAEVYGRGVLFLFSRVVGTVVSLCTAYWLLPIFYKMSPTSIYQYYEDRFHSRILRRIGAALFLFFLGIYMAVVLYAPAVAISGVSGLATWISIVSVGVVCILYTALGGLKAVVWANVLQAAIILFGVVTLFFKGAVDAGGIRKSFSVAAEHGRFAVMGYVNPTPFMYMNLWSSILGGASFWFSMLTFNQLAMQRFISMPTLRSANIVIALTIPAFMLLLLLSDLMGIVMFAYFKDCDPLGSKIVQFRDQLVVYFCMLVFDGLPGLPGVFLAAIVSGTLSTVSSGINSMAAVLWEDFLKQRFSYLSEKRQGSIIKITTLLFGVLSIALAFLAEPLGGVLTAFLSIMGATAGPLVGLFILGIFFPFAEKRGAFIGLVVSVPLTLWVSLGSVVYKPYAMYNLPLFYDGCNDSMIAMPRCDWLNFTTNSMSPMHGFNHIYAISDIMFTFIGSIVVVIVGVPVSFFFGDKFVKPTLRYTIKSLGNKQLAIEEDEKHTPLPDESEMKLIHRHPATIVNDRQNGEASATVGLIHANA